MSVQQRLTDGSKGVNEIYPTPQSQIDISNAGRQKTFRKIQVIDE